MDKDQMLVWQKGAIYWLLFCTIYFVLAMISLETRDPWSLSSTVGLPVGLVLGTLCTCPRTYWPIWGVSAGLLHIFFSVLFGRSLDIALIFALLDLVVIFPLAMIWHSAQRYLNHLSYRSKVLLLLLSVYIASALGGLIGTLTLMMLDYPVLLSHSFTWSLSNATGCLSSAPFLIIRNMFKEKPPPFSIAQISALILVPIVFLLPPYLLESALLRQMLLYLVLGISLVLATMWPMRTLTLYFFFLSLLVSLTTLYGYGPLAEMDLQGMQASQLYLLAVISLGLLSAAHQKEHAVRNDKQQEQLHLLSQLLHQQQPVFFQLSANGMYINWLSCESVFDIPVEQMPTLHLLLARMHPEDRADFSARLVADNTTTRASGQCILRLLLSDCQYHRVRSNLVYGHPQFGTLGVFMLSG